MTGDPRASLLQRVLDDPTDDGAKLVYADVLLAAGDQRGELIVVEHGLRAAPSAELRHRRRGLLRRHGASWWPDPFTWAKLRVPDDDQLPVEIESYVDRARAAGRPVLDRADRPRHGGVGVITA